MREVLFVRLAAFIVVWLIERKECDIPRTDNLGVGELRDQEERACLAIVIRFTDAMLLVHCFALLIPTRTTNALTVRTGWCSTRTFCDQNMTVSEEETNCTNGDHSPPGRYNAHYDEATKAVGKFPGFICLQ